MLKKNKHNELNEPEDIYELTEDEVNNLALKFLRDFTEVLENNETYYKNHHVFRILEDLYNYAKNQLEYMEGSIA